MGCYELPLARWSKEVFLKKMFFDLVFEALTELHTWTKIREMGIAYVKINLGSTWIVSQKWHKSLGKKSSRWTRYQGVSGYFINSLRWLGGKKDLWTAFMQKLFCSVSWPCHPGWRQPLSLDPGSCLQTCFLCSLFTHFFSLQMACLALVGFQPTSACLSVSVSCVLNINSHNEVLPMD